MHKLARAAIRLNFNFRNHALNGRWGNNVDELDEILANGTDEEIEAALAGLDIDGDTLFGNEDGEEAPVVEAKVEVPHVDSKPKQESKPTETDVEAAPSAEEGKQGEAPEGFVEIDGEYYVKATDVSSKNGQHSLPYDVLVQTRERAAAAEAEAAAVGSRAGHHPLHAFHHCVPPGRHRPRYRQLAETHQRGATALS